MIRKNFAFVLAFYLLAFGQSIYAQKLDGSKIEPQAVLVQSGLYDTSELASLYIDTLRGEMRKNPNSKGVFVIYCGKTCKYGEIEAHVRGLSLSLNGKGWEKSEFAIMQGGFKESFTVEYWMIPEKIGLPIPDSTIDIKDVKFKGTFKRKIVYYDCC